MVQRLSTHGETDVKNWSNINHSVGVWLGEKKIYKLLVSTQIQKNGTCGADDIKK